MFVLVVVGFPFPFLKNQKSKGKNKYFDLLSSLPVDGISVKSGRKMHKENMVRRLSACETMGGPATTISSDKTGTLTLNKGLLAGLESKEWVVVCESLNNVWRLSIYHKEAMLHPLVNVSSLVEKSLKNPRSDVCKTAIMTSEDIFKAYGDHIIDSIDPLIVQLLLKSSQDKRFVCEAAEKSSGGNDYLDLPYFISSKDDAASQA